MWTEAHRARHDARLKEIVSLNAVGQIARWLERADPPRSGRATPYAAVVRAIAWHLRIGGPWRALPPGGPHWRTVYGWFRKWQEQGLFDRLLEDVARRRRRAVGRRAKPRLSIIDTQAGKGISVRGPRGYDAAKKVLGRKRVALVDADGTWLAVAVVPASVQDRDTLEALDPGKAASCIGAGCCATGLAVWTSPPLASRSRPACPASRLCSTLCQSKTLQGNLTQTGSKTDRYPHFSFVG